MIEHNYSIEEILIALDDLQKIKKNKKTKFVTYKEKKKDNSNIPKNTLRLIEEAEKSKY